MRMKRVSEVDQNPGTVSYQASLEPKFQRSSVRQNSVMDDASSKFFSRCFAKHYTCKLKQ